jgi:hypothetical protein
LIKNVPEEKLCPFCNTVKPSREFQRNAARSDGLTYTCKICIPLYAAAPKRQRLDLADVSKTCSSCNRYLNARAFMYAQSSPDRLASKCRTCKMYRPQGNPTVEQVEDFEAQLTEILQDVMNILDFDKERAQFEAAVYEQLQHKGLLKDWKPPVWIHKSSII